MTSWAGTVSTRSEISKHSQISEHKHSQISEHKHSQISEQSERDTDEPKMNCTGVTKKSTQINCVFFACKCTHWPSADSQGTSK